MIANEAGTNDMEYHRLGLGSRSHASSQQENEEKSYYACFRFHHLLLSAPPSWKGNFRPLNKRDAGDILFVPNGRERSCAYLFRWCSRQLSSKEIDAGRLAFWHIARVIKSFTRAVVVLPAIEKNRYPDVREAVNWLCEAFGFEERLQIGENHRSQLRIGDGAVIIGDVRNDRRQPRPGEVTHQVMVRVENAKAHCKHAREHGARILMEPTDFEYGERQYTAEDLAGHQWTFTETLNDVDPKEWGGLAKHIT